MPYSTAVLWLCGLVLRQGGELQVHGRNGRLSGLRKRKSAAALVQVETSPIEHFSPGGHNINRTCLATLLPVDNSDRIGT